MITENSSGRKPELYEMLDNIEKAQNREDRVNLVRQYGKKYQSFNDYLRCIFDETIEFALPKGRPPYTPAGEMPPSSWHKRHIDLAYFVKGLSADKVNTIKREALFIGVLESIHENDALHISLISDKKCLVDGLDSEVIDEALPGLLVKRK